MRNSSVSIIGATYSPGASSYGRWNHEIAPCRCIVLSSRHPTHKNECVTRRKQWALGSTRWEGHVLAGWARSEAGGEKGRESPPGHPPEFHDFGGDLSVIIAAQRGDKGRQQDGRTLCLACFGFTRLQQLCGNPGHFPRRRDWPRCRHTLLAVPKCYCYTGMDSGEDFCTGWTLRFTNAFC